ncbi:hypothetical protein [Endozoicomonas lisbonensis]|uniref:Transglutaminase-like domain-containing protein n=1 Tax=Endozoicomonas lisbonensis TaxID=3120522 RepID=A0ABV2SJ38_9GAMM
MNEKDNARELLTYARLFFKDSLKSANKTFSMSYGTASPSRKQLRIDNSEKAFGVINDLRGLSCTHEKLNLLHSADPKKRAGNCTEYAEIAIRRGCEVRIPNIWLAIHDLHKLLVLADTPSLRSLALNEFERYEGLNFWVCDPWFNIYCKMHLYDQMMTSRSARWKNEGKEIHSPRGTETATQWRHRLHSGKIRFTRMTDSNGSPTRDYELYFSRYRPTREGCLIL